MLRGTICNFDPTKFGFIKAPPFPHTLFFHATWTVPGVTLRVNDEVDFLLALNPKTGQPAAQQVQLSAATKHRSLPLPLPLSQRTAAAGGSGAGAGGKGQVQKPPRKNSNNQPAPAGGVGVGGAGAGAGVGGVLLPLEPVSGGSAPGSGTG